MTAKQFRRGGVAIRGCDTRREIVYMTSVRHRYGGMTITETGMHPDVKALVYVAAVQPDVGESLADLADKMPPTCQGHRTSWLRLSGSEPRCVSE